MFGVCFLYSLDRAGLLVEISLVAQRLWISNTREACDGGLDEVCGTFEMLPIRSSDGVFAPQEAASLPTRVSVDDVLNKFENLKRVGLEAKRVEINAKRPTPAPMAAPPVPRGRSRSPAVDAHKAWETACQTWNEEPSECE